MLKAFCLLVRVTLVVAFGFLLVRVTLVVAFGFLPLEIILYWSVSVV